MFRKFLSRKKSVPPVEFSRPILPSAVVQTIVAFTGQKTLPSMPANAQKAFEISTNPKAEPRDFVELLENDEALSARIIKIANSVYFDRGNGSKTIVEAVATIGTSELRSLLGANILSELFHSNHPLRAKLWKHDVYVALASRTLARNFAPDAAEEAFLAGLMHDVGKLMLLQRVPAEYQKVVDTVGAHRTFHRAEQETFPFDHTLVGHFIAETWRFGDTLTHAIRLHHEPWENLSLQTTPVTFIVKLADNLIHRYWLDDFKSQSLRDYHAEELAAGLALTGKAENLSAEELATFVKKTLSEEAEFYLGDE
ncbi:MAG: HDOD domain-containing protein [Bdellovibrionales bacterium]|nr:HDOD domain-containing protein [Bdellovibrionales bacterium]